MPGAVALTQEPVWTDMSVELLDGAAANASFDSKTFIFTATLIGTKFNIF